MGLAPSPSGKLLDVGCGNGDFMLRMRGLGWNVSGVDPDPAAVTRGLSHGLEIFSGMVADVPGDAQYDVITLNHVMEHVADPVGVLRECRRRLRPQTGRVVITTPNITSLGHWWFKRHWRGLEVPRHLVVFSPDALSACIAHAGLVVRTLRTETRLARMIYAPSACAQEGGRDVGERTDFKVSTKCAAYAFQVLEDVLALFKRDIGEEIYCVCAAAKENDGEQ
jgi:2-polyprenyl-3-methyl-5-hydroxy-6-metoxy-1,4-benzoquinol methylase